MPQSVWESSRFSFKSVPTVRIRVGAIVIHILPVIINDQSIDVDVVFLQTLYGVQYLIFGQALSERIPSALYGLLMSLIPT